MTHCFRLNRRILSGGAVAGLLVTITCLYAGPLSAVERTVMRASALIDLIGANTHMIFTDGAYAKVGNVLDDLKFLGIRHCRDVLPGAASQPALQGRDAIRRMVHENVKLNIFVPSDWTPM